MVEVTLAQEELKKVFNLSKEGVKVEMFSEAIDDVWHNMLENKKEYHQFCYDSVGVKIKHNQNKSYGNITFISKYEKKYGALPLIWFMDKSGKVNTNLYKKYQDNGTVIDSWDCEPEPDPDA